MDFGTHSDYTQFTKTGCVQGMAFALKELMINVLLKNVNHMHLLDTHGHGQAPPPDRSTVGNISPFASLCKT